jgi:AraC-like DNA-binding protein
MNILQELEMKNTYVDTNILSSSMDEPVQMHSHLFYEIIFFQQGHLQYLMGSRRYDIQPGDLLIIPPGIHHGPLFQDGQTGNYVRYILWLSTAFVQNTASVFPPTEVSESKHFLFRGTAASLHQLTRLFENGVRENKSRELGWDLVLYSNTTLLLVTICRFYKGKQERIKNRKAEFIDQLLAYIDRNLENKITLESSAQYFYVSKSTITQAFRENMHLSFYQYVQQTRLNTAKGKISEGLALETIAKEVGYQDYSTFFRAFKKEFGISPLEYRQQLLT